MDIEVNEIMARLAPESVLKIAQADYENRVPHQVNPLERVLGPELAIPKEIKIEAYGGPFVIASRPKLEHVQKFAEISSLFSDQQIFESFLMRCSFAPVEYFDARKSFARVGKMYVKTQQYAPTPQEPTLWIGIGVLLHKHPYSDHRYPAIELLCLGDGAKESENVLSSREYRKFDEAQESHIKLAAYANKSYVKKYRDIINPRYLRYLEVTSRIMQA